MERRETREEKRRRRRRWARAGLLGAEGGVTTWTSVLLMTANCAHAHFRLVGIEPATYLLKTVVPPP